MITVSRAPLAVALKKAMPGVESGKSLLVGADAFVFMNGKIHTYNNFLSVTTSQPSGLNLTGAVKAQEFYDLVAKLKGDEILLDDSVAGQWTLQCGPVEVTLTHLQEKVTERIGTIAPKADWHEVPDRFLPALTNCVLPGNSSTLSGVYSSEGYLCSTDEMRINFFHIGKDIGTWWIADNTVPELLKVGKLERFQLNDGWLHFESDDTVVSCKRLVSDKYPFDKIKAVVEKHDIADGDIRGTLPNNLKDAVSRAGALAQGIETFDEVVLRFRPDGVLVTAQKSAGKYKELVPWETAPAIQSEFYIRLDQAMVMSGLKLTQTFYLKEVMTKLGPSRRLILQAADGLQMISALSDDAGGK